LITERGRFRPTPTNTGKNAERDKEGRTKLRPGKRGA